MYMIHTIMFKKYDGYFLIVVMKNESSSKIIMIARIWVDINMQ